MVSRAFSSMPGLACGIARQIRDGEIKKFLIQPIDMLGFLLLSRVAHKLAYYSVAVATVRAWCSSCAAVISWTAGRTWRSCRLFPAALVMGFVLGFFLEVYDRADRLLVPGSQLAAVRLHAVQLLSVGAHVSAGHAAGAVGRDRGRACRCKYLAYFPGGGVSGQGAARTELLGRAVDRGGLDRVLHRCCRASCSSAGCGVTAVLEDERDTVTMPDTSFLLARLPDVRPQQPGARHDVSHELPARSASRPSPGC